MNEKFLRLREKTSEKAGIETGFLHVGHYVEGQSSDANMKEGRYPRCRGGIVLRYVWPVRFGRVAGIDSSGEDGDSVSGLFF